MDVNEEVLEIGKKFMEKYDGAFKQLAEIERQELIDTSQTGTQDPTRHSKCPIITSYTQTPDDPKTQLQQEIQNLEATLHEFKEQLSSYKTSTIEDAEVGDTLEDGSIVLSKENGIALLVAPKNTEVRAPWTKEFPEVFKSLKEQGFNPSQWFIPTIEQLKFAYEIIPDEFSSTGYWSSTEFDAANACNLYFGSGNAYIGNKANLYCVRAFRCVTF